MENDRVTYLEQKLDTLELAITAFPEANFYLELFSCFKQVLVIHVNSAKERR